MIVAAFAAAVVAMGMLCLSVPAWADSTVYPYGQPPAAATAACPAGGTHAFKETTLSNATEDTDGVRLFTCSKCGYSFREAIPRTGHEWGPWIVDVAPTCTTEGSRHRECDRYPSNPHFEYQVIPALAATGQHTWGDWVVDVAATQTAEGSEHRTCSVCGAVETQVLPMLVEQAPQTTVPVLSAASESADTFASDRGEADGPASDAQPQMLGPFINSFTPNVTDAAMATADGVVLAVGFIIGAPLITAYIWLRRKEREARDRCFADGAAALKGDDA